jgi:hypothetical protein
MSISTLRLKGLVFHYSLCVEYDFIFRKRQVCFRFSRDLQYHIVSEEIGTTVSEELSSSIFRRKRRRQQIFSPWRVHDAVAQKTETHTRHQYLCRICLIEVRFYCWWCSRTLSTVDVSIMSFLLRTRIVSCSSSSWDVSFH